MSTVNRRRRRGLVLAATLWPFVLVAPVAAQAPREEPRLALVIGNSAYREAPLRNPVNDARAMAQRLRELGFTVIAHENATKRTMEAAIIEFGRRLGEGGVGAFYYAGHGLQVRGRNYLVPVDCEIDDEASTRVAAVDVELLLEQMNEARNRINLVVLDACRNNPFERRMRGGSRGLAAADAARGTLIAYATALGSVAADGEGGNGLYTEELLAALNEPGLKIEEVFKRVRINVSRRSRGAQTPWESSSLTGDLVVNSSGVAAAAVPAATAPAPVPERLAALSPPARPRDAARFDGVWTFTVQCPAHGGAAGYTKRLVAHVKDGALSTQQGSVGQPNSLILSGTIQPDGKASIEARGAVGDSRNAAGALSRGSGYVYRVDAVFEDTRGSGNRADDVRPCSLTFVK